MERVRPGHRVHSDGGLRLRQNVAAVHQLRRKRPGHRRSSLRAGGRGFWLDRRGQRRSPTGVTAADPKIVDRHLLHPAENTDATKPHGNTT